MLTNKDPTNQQLKPKPTLHLLPTDPTLEEMVAFLQKVRGKKMTEQEIAGVEQVMKEESETPAQAKDTPT